MRRNPWEMLIPEGTDPLWLTADMRLVPVSQMDNEHLQNLERMLLGRGGVDPSFRQIGFVRWYDIIRDELDRRGVMPIDWDHPRAKARQEREH